MTCSQNFVCGNTTADVNGWPVRYTDCDQLNLYAHRVLGNNSPFLQVVISSLSTNRITYCKIRAGDCGSSGFAPSGSSAAELTAAHGLATAASADPEPISKTISGILASVLGFFGAAHAQAVATEQATLCRVADGWNTWIQGAEIGLASGQVSIQDAMSQLSQIYASLSNTARSVAKTPGDAANYYKAALDALVIWNQEIVFPSLAAQAGLLGSATSSLGITVPPSLIAAAKTPTGKLVLVAGGAALLAKLLGIF